MEDFGDTEKREDCGSIKIENHEERLRGTVTTQQCEVHCSNNGKWTIFLTTYCIPRHFPVQVIDPLPTERFPEYVRDMLYGEENKLKAEFSVSVMLCINSAKTRQTLHSSN